MLEIGERGHHGHLGSGCAGSAVVVLALAMTRPTPLLAGDDDRGRYDIHRGVQGDRGHGF